MRDAFVRDAFDVQDPENLQTRKGDQALEKRTRAHQEARKAVESAGPMRVQILSDLHIEFPGNTIPALAADAELIILAGDLAPVHTRRVGDIAKRWAGADRIVYVPGNHEFYGSEIDVARRELARQCLQHGVTPLDPGAVTISDVMFIGATLWTDFLLEGVAGEAWAHLEVGQGLADFTGAIRHHGSPEGRFTTRECARRHAEHRAFIEAELERAERWGMTAVIITTTRQARSASGPGSREVVSIPGSRRTSMR